MKLFIALVLLGLTSQVLSICDNYHPCTFEGTGGRPLKQPKQEVSEDGDLHITLRMAMDKVKIEWLTIYRRLYNGEFPGPTWRIKRGDIVNVTIINTLTLPQKVKKFNTPIYPNATNMHTHGLHISGESPEDNVFVHIEPGETYTYNYTIIDNHPSGTYWYHPHIHGSTMLQVTGGMAGMIIVEDPVRGKYRPPKHLRDVSCPRHCEHEVHLVFQPFLQYISRFGRGYADNQRQIEENVKFRNLNKIYQNGKLTNTTLEQWLENPVNNIDYFTTNGQLFPTMNLKAGQMKRFRMVNAGGSMSLELIVVKKGTNTSACRYKEIAMDGIYLNKARIPRLKKTFLVPSAKADWLIVCDDPGVYELRSIASASDDMSIGVFQRYSGLMLTINVTGRKRRRRTVIKNKLPKRQPFISDFRQLKQCDTTGRFAVEISSANILNREYFKARTDYRFVAELDTVQEWYLLNSDHFLTHPIHIHVNHFQVISYNKYVGPVSYHNRATHVITFFDQKGKLCYFQEPNYVKGSSTFNSSHLKYLGHDQRWKGNGVGTLGYVQEGDFRDVILVPPLSNITIRFKTDRFLGTVVMHCHILTHEDRGMMMTTKIVPPGSPPSAMSANTFSPAGFPGTCNSCDPYPFDATQKCCYDKTGKATCT